MAPAFQKAGESSRHHAQAGGCAPSAATTPKRGGSGPSAIPFTDVQSPHAPSRLARQTPRRPRAWRGRRPTCRSSSTNSST
eukprot:1671256-Prymnesium_polylepis.1